MSNENGQFPDARNSDSGWERKVLEKIALEGIIEQRRARRWGIFFKSLTFLCISFVVFAISGFFFKKDPAIASQHTALVELRGVIDAEGQASADRVISGLQEAFKDVKTQGVILRINSPGGSPVQAGRINDEIYRLRKLHPSIHVYAVVEDICASGGYYAAVAADQIFVDKASLVGSIGVLMDGFGFTGAMEKFGVERRLLTAGENKGFLDPFSPISESQKDTAKQMLGEIHQQFIDVVKKGRGKRLKESSETFSGLVWTGEKSIQLGLADGLGNIQSVAREIIKAEDIVDFTPEDNIAEKFARRIGAASAESFNSLLLGSKTQLR